MAITLRKADRIISGRVELPASKSISNRVQIIRALCADDFEIHNLSEAGDSAILGSLLEQAAEEGTTLDCGPAGTTFRFLAAYLATIPGTRTLTGSDRMLQRPVGHLVEGLRQLGADIKYVGKEDHPPLKITGGKLKGGNMRLDGSVSSQFVSALLMIAPTLEGGLTIDLVREPVSKPYIEMTIAMMREFGVRVKWEDRKLIVPQADYEPAEFTVEVDWTAASYWYELAAFSEEVSLELAGLQLESLQGDAVVQAIFERLGVSTIYSRDAIKLTRNDKQLPAVFEKDCSDLPDLAQTLALTCAGLRVPCKLSGLQTLRIKETDRLSAVQTELAKLGLEVMVDGSVLKIPRSQQVQATTTSIQTYDDHRMAMAFAPLAMLTGELTIEDEQVVCKSYPGFWKDLEQVGFECLPAG